MRAFGLPSVPVRLAAPIPGILKADVIRPAAQPLVGSRELPVVDHVAERPVVREAPQLVDRVEQDVVRTVVVDQPVVEPSRFFLAQVRHAVRVIVIADAERLAPDPEAGETEAAVEPPRHRRLQRVVVPVAAVVVHVDVAVAGVRPQEIVRQRRSTPASCLGRASDPDSAARNVAPNGGALICDLRSRSVEVEPTYAMSTMISCHQLVLDTDVPLSDARRFEIERYRSQRERGEWIGAGRRH